MYCKNCGNKLNNKSNYCPSCGKSSSESETITPNTNNEGKGRAIASMIIGIISLVFSGLLFIPLPIVGLIMGLSYKGKCAEKTAGIILNIISLLWALVAIILVVILFATGVFEEAFDNAIDNVDLNDVNLNIQENWEEYSKYIEKDAYDSTTDITGYWKELSENKSLLIFRENDYYFYSDIKDMELNYKTGKYTFKKGSEALTTLLGGNKLFSKIFSKFDVFNINVLIIESEKTYLNGKEISNNTYGDESKYKIAIITTHDDVVELILEDDGGNEERHFYKVLESNE